MNRLGNSQPTGWKVYQSHQILLSILNLNYTLVNTAHMRPFAR